MTRTRLPAREPPRSPTRRNMWDALTETATKIGHDRPWAGVAVVAIFAILIMALLGIALLWGGSAAAAVLPLVGVGRRG